MITVMLYGALAQKFGRRHRFDIRTPAEAVRALSANLPGFRQHLLEHSEPGYRVLVGKKARDADALGLPADDVVRIVPVVAGAGKGAGQVIAGIILVVIAIWNPMGWGALATTMIRSVGMSMAMSGISTMLAKNPAVSGPPERADNKPSYTFDGAVNTSAQGNGVIVSYGLIEVGSQVISAGLTADPA